MRTLRRYRKPLGWFMCMLMATWLPGPARGATLSWVGGSGVWDTTSPNWNPGLVAWTNGGDFAQYGGVPSTVTLGEAITAGQLIYQVPSSAGVYTLNGGGNALTLLGSGYSAS